MFRLYRDVEDGVEAPDVLAPTIQSARIDVTNGDISIQMKNARSLLSIEASGQPLTTAFFFNGTETLRPDSVWIEGTTVVLRPASGTTVTTVSYVPSKYDPFTNAVYAGPWLTDEVGVGVLTFHNIPVIPSSVDESEESTPIPSVVVRRSDLSNVADHQIIFDMHGASTTDPSTLAPGVYVIVRGQGVSTTRQLVMVTE
jgi:hypothetical protein